MRLYEQASVILEGRLSGWMVKRAGIKALKVFLTAPLEVSAERVACRDDSSIKEALQKVKQRDAIDRKRYMKLYDIDIKDESVYDLIFDTTQFGVVDEVDAIISQLSSIEE